MKPLRVVVVGRDISLGVRPWANSSTALLVAFMLANSYEPSSPKSSKPPTRQTRALPSMMVSTPMSTDSTAVAHAPTGVLMGPDDDSSSMLTHAAMVLMKDSCRMSFCSGLSRKRSRCMPRSAVAPPMPEPMQLPSSDTWMYW